MQCVPLGGLGACGVREVCSAGISQPHSLPSRASGQTIRNGDAGVLLDSDEDSGAEEGTVDSCADCDAAGWLELIADTVRGVPWN